MTGSAGQIIYQAFVPTLNMALCIGTGFVIAKVGGVTPASIKGISFLTMNVGLPCLIFSSMVSSFTPETVSAFGPLIMMAVIYQSLGLLLAWIVREVAYVPRDFRWGFLVMGVISNWGNLPTAIVQAVARNEPFDPATDVDLGIGYIAVFVLVMNTTFFGLGVHRICGWDFNEDRAIADPLPFRQRWQRRLQRLRRLFATAWSRLTGPRVSSTPVESVRSSLTPTLRSSSSCSTMECLPQTNSYQSQNGIDAVSLHSTSGSRTPSVNEKPVGPPAGQEQAAILPLSNTTKQSLKTSLWEHFLKVLRYIPTPTWAVIFGVSCSLIQPLKALFIDTPSWTSVRVPNAPDGKPPLHFLLDTTKLLGAITVPLALMLLGASFSQLKFPRQWNDFPLVAIVSMTAIKMIIIPVFSVFVVLALQGRTNLFPPEQKIRTFVTILLSGTPAAANQLVVTQLYNPAGTAHTVSKFLLLQYLLMFILSTALAAVALYIVQ